MYLPFYRFSLIGFWGFLAITGYGVVSFGDEPQLAIGPRTPWTTSRLQGSPDPPLPYSIERLFPQIEFTNPTVLTNAPGNDRLFVAEVKGAIYSFPNNATEQQPDLLIDVSEYLGKNAQVYGFTFHPQFLHNRYCYVCYVAPDQVEGTRVSQFKVLDVNPPRIDTDSERILLTWPAGGHNGGCLKFGPDGYLYITTGDAGPPNPPDPKLAGQDVSNLLSSILRIDVDHSENNQPYTIPTDNPFVGLAGARDEIWCYGLRNPWKISFDKLTGQLWVGDVGWHSWEMIYRVQRGGNYGWSLMDGPQSMRLEGKQGPTPILPPTVVHSHDDARSISGGFVYRGSRLSGLTGTYVYGDFVTGKIWGIPHDAQPPIRATELVDTTLQVIGFGVDSEDELLVLDYGGGIYRLVPNMVSKANQNFPRTLSETGLFQDVKNHRVFAGVIPYSINAEPWADHTTAARFLALPDDTTIDVKLPTNAANDALAPSWNFPDNAILMKTVSLEMEAGNPATRRRLETQILHHASGKWQPYTYIWNEDQTEAVLAEDTAQERTYQLLDSRVADGKRIQTYHFASRSECLLCHAASNGSIHGFSPVQLNRQHRYGNREANQLTTLSRLGIFSAPLSQDTPAWPSPVDSTAGLDQRARVYLHVNCAHCHRPQRGGPANMDIRFNVALEETRLVDLPPAQGTFGLLDARLLAPGDPYRSLLFYRMTTTGRGHMPKFGSSLADEQGMLLIQDWIAGLDTESTDLTAPASLENLRTVQHHQLDLLQSSSSSSTDQLEAINQLLTHTSGAMMLASSLSQVGLTADTRQRVLNQAASISELEIRDLFERFLPRDQRLERLGTNVDRERIARLPGDSQRGHRLFSEAKIAQCKNCHRAGQVGQTVGPELTLIGKKFNRLQLLESILEPSKVIDPKYVTYTIETKQGKLHSGLVIEKSGEQITLKDGQGNLIQLPAAEISNMISQQKSLMPENLLRDMTIQQVADLLAFLESLK